MLIILGKLSEVPFKKHTRAGSTRTSNMRTVEVNLCSNSVIDHYPDKLILIFKN